MGTKVHIHATISENFAGAPVAWMNGQVKVGLILTASQTISILLGFKALAVTASRSIGAMATIRESILFNIYEKFVPVANVPQKQERVDFDGKLY